MYRAIIFLALCSFGLSAVADDSVFESEHDASALKAEYRGCHLDEDCSYMTVEGCIGNLPVNNASKENISSIISRSDAAMNCIIVPPKKEPPDYVVHCVNKLCEWEAVTVK